MLAQPLNASIDLSTKPDGNNMHTGINKNTPLYIAPANPAGRKLAKRLRSAGYCVNGFVDNLKQGDDIVNDVAHFPATAKVVLHKATYTDNVAAGLLQRQFKQKRLWLCHDDDGSPLSTASSTQPEHTAACNISFARYALPLSYRLNKLLFAICSRLFWMARLTTPKRRYLYYAEGFFDTNVLLAYREHKRQFANEPFLLGINLKQKISELDEDKEKFEKLSLKVLWRICCARRIIVDHEYTGDTFRLLRKRIPVVQLWHGLPYKALSGNRHYPDICDEVFVSSSDWFNKEIFPKIFRAKAYLSLGYPRNDAFSQSPMLRDWINAEPYNTLQQIQKNAGDIIVYAPTYRDWGNNEYPLDLAAIDTWCRKHNRAFVLKFHPFISRLFGEAMGLTENNALQQLPSYPNIYLYPSGKNIYPWLAQSYALVTDYSSIAYDFLLSDKPIVYFQYDKEEYLKLRGETLVSDSDFIAGEVVESTEEMLTALGNTKPHSSALKMKFGMKNQLASEQICRLVRD